MNCTGSIATIIGLPEELRKRIAELEEEKAAAERELADLKDRATRVRDLVRDREARGMPLEGEALDAREMRFTRFDEGESYSSLSLVRERGRCRQWR